jgi:hypothetical protein
MSKPHRKSKEANHLFITPSRGVQVGLEMGEAREYLQQRSESPLNP